MTDFRRLVETLTAGKADFILIGGVAGAIHGAVRNTRDIDMVYSRRPENLQRIVRSLAPYEPYLRGAPPGLPFRWDEQTLAHGLNFTLTTTLGAIDLLGEVAGGGTYEDLVGESEMTDFLGCRCRCVTLERLIRLKRAAGRPRDFEALAELELLSSLKKNAGSPG